MLRQALIWLARSALGRLLFQGFALAAFGALSAAVVVYHWWERRRSRRLLRLLSRKKGIRP